MQRALTGPSVVAAHDVRVSFCMLGPWRVEFGVVRLRGWHGVGGGGGGGWVDVEHVTHGPWARAILSSRRRGDCLLFTIEILCV